MSHIKLGNDWDEVIGEEFGKDYFQNLQNFLDKEYALGKENAQKAIYPPKDDIFNAFKLTPYSKIRVVILGQDPYPNFPGQAHGLAFSVLQDFIKKGGKFPPALYNIFKEINKEFPERKRSKAESCLCDWAEQGILLLNTALTVRHGAAGSHLKEWNEFTDKVITKIAEKDSPVIFLLWGEKAKSKKKLLGTAKEEKILNINKNGYVSKLLFTKKHFILESPQPAFGFMFSDCKHFKGVNKIIKENNLGEEIVWSNS